jgi:hypothetical protein
VHRDKEHSRRYCRLAVPHEKRLIGALVDVKAAISNAIGILFAPSACYWYCARIEFFKCMHRQIGFLLSDALDSIIWNDIGETEKNPIHVS